MKTTLKTRLLAASMLSVLLILVLMVSLSSYVIRNSALSSTQREVRELSNTFAAEKGQWMYDRQNAVKSLAATLSRHIDEDPTRYLLEIHEALSFGLTYYGSEQGDMLRQDPSLFVAGYDPRIRPWYKGAKETDGLFVTAPYESATMKTLVVTIAEPVKVGGQLRGVAAANLAIDKLTSSVRKLKLPGDGYGILLENSGVIISHPDAALNGKNIAQVDNRFSTSWLKKRADSDELEQMKYDGAEKLLYVAELPHTDWMLLFVIDKKTIMSEATRLAWSMIGTGLVFLLVFAAVLFVVFRIQFRDLEKVATALQDIAEGEGDLTVRITTKNQHDEIGQLATGFNQFVLRLHQMITRMSDIAKNLSAQSEELRGAADSNSQIISVQQDEITQVATAVTEMSSATAEIASNAELTAHTAQDSVTLTNSGQQQVIKSQSSIRNLATEVATAGQIIGELNEHSQKISGILLTISGIAEQTNLLALNAAIEAARAGDQGRGFAVVADEVRVLSQRTHDSTQEIQTMIEALQRTASKAVDSMQGSHQMAETSVMDAETASASLEQIANAINRISEMASQIATAAEEQTSVTSEINRNTEAIREVSENLSSSAVTAADKAQMLADLALSLQQEVGRFRL
ncbi:methyl-accepting chemotaxis protein [Shewanella sp. 4t3-1-2LB]|uniref:methyl-accepting chemotaxis protein n=1 Tax=Shewanella sp. 4t3-1-2LB TaxID=2817682 RepID=UPI001A99DB6B|nr:methyl-accepting chemotaxis protein [Shewanella sp. 4t3-1-2LB]MBO1271229.1 methyl-accepting chemotaxis protein [Shewanella sp. 4t3-1-2LB]